MNANDLANKYRNSPMIRDLLNRETHVPAIAAIRQQEGCGLLEAREAVLILKGQGGKMFTDHEVRDMIVRNAINRLTLTELEQKYFREKGLID